MTNGDVDDLEWVDELATEIFNDHTLAGLAVGIVRDGELARFAGVGLADAAAGRPVEADTVFRIGSITKTFTGIATLQLAEEGCSLSTTPSTSTSARSGSRTTIPRRHRSRSGIY